MIIKVGIHTPTMQSTYYILKNKKIVPCNNAEVWQQCMDNLPLRTVGSDVAGEYGVHTTFIGVNLGNEFMPKFFKTIVTGDDGQNDPWLSETWEQAQSTHKAVIRTSIWLTQAAEKQKVNQLSGAKVMDSFILPDNELQFILEQ